MLSTDYKEFIKLLNEREVEYLVVGGYAVGFYGSPRYTGDIDFWIKPAKLNAEKIMEVLKEFGFGSIGITEADFLKESGIIQLGYPPLRINILTSIDGVDSDECYKKKCNNKFDGISIKFISKNDLIKNKQASNRLKDQLDLENLIN